MATAQRARVCPECGALNGPDERSCYRCGTRLGSTGAFGLMHSLLGREFPITKLLVGICLLNFAGMTLDHGALPLGLLSRLLPGDAPLQPSVMLRFGMILGDLGVAEPFRLLSAVYAHFGVLHLVFNLLALVSFGRELEAQLGGSRVLIAFVVTGFLGFVATALWWSISDSLFGFELRATAGASGGLFGLIGVQIGVLHARRDPALKEIFTRYLVYAVAFALMLPVNNAAHLGGFVVGYGFGRLFAIERRPYERRLLVGGVAVSLALASLGSIVLSLRSPIWQEVRAQEIRQGLR